MKKKLISMLLLICMVASLVPGAALTVYAENEETQPMAEQPEEPVIGTEETPAGEPVENINIAPPGGGLKNPS